MATVTGNCMAGYGELGGVLLVILFILALLGFTGFWVAFYGFLGGGGLCNALRFNALRASKIFISFISFIKRNTGVFG